MGKRREPRKEIKVPVRIFGTDKSGQIFSEKVFTSNVSQHGALLAGVQAQPEVDEIVGVTYREAKGHFRVRWVGQPGTPQAGTWVWSIWRPTRPSGTSLSLHPVSTLQFAMPRIVARASGSSAPPRLRSIGLARLPPSAPGQPISAWADAFWKCQVPFLKQPGLELRSGSKTPKYGQTVKL